MKRRVGVEKEKAKSVSASRKPDRAGKIFRTSCAEALARTCGRAVGIHEQKVVRIVVCIARRAVGQVASEAVVDAEWSQRRIAGPLLVERVGLGCGTHCIEPIAQKEIIRVGSAKQCDA